MPEPVDLSGEDDPDEAARALALEDAATPFDLERSAVRASLLRLGPDRHALLLTMHNVVPDEHATDDVEAGPYPVMVAELQREPQRSSDTARTVE